MKSIESRIEIERPAEEVFAFVADQTNAPRWQDGLSGRAWSHQRCTAFFKEILAAHLMPPPEPLYQRVASRPL